MMEQITGGLRAVRAWGVYLDAVAFVECHPKYDAHNSLYWYPTGSKGDPLNVPRHASSLVDAFAKAGAVWGQLINQRILFDDGSTIYANRCQDHDGDELLYAAVGAPIYADRWMWHMALAVPEGGYAGPYPAGQFTEADDAQVAHRLVVAAQAVPRDKEVS